MAYFVKDGIIFKNVFYSNTLSSNQLQELMYQIRISNGSSKR